MLNVPNVEESKASGVGRHIRKNEDIAARKGDVGSQCSGRAVIDGYETHDEGIIFFERVDLIITGS